MGTKTLPHPFRSSPNPETFGERSVIPEHGSRVDSDCSRTDKKQELSRSMKMLTHFSAGLLNHDSLATIKKICMLRTFKTDPRGVSMKLDGAPFWRRARRPISSPSDVEGS